MKIQILTDHLVVPDFPAFYAGQTYEVGDDIANQLIERMQAIPAPQAQPKDVEVAPEKKGKRQVSN